jgi:peptidoglycan hydrolase-like protein with peptidoglycan-binding domain
MPEDYSSPKVPKVKVRAPKATEAVQKRLVALGYLASNAVNGKYDYRTQQAVLAFQSWEGLERDGVAGSRTQARLKAAGRPKPEDDEEGKYVEIYRDRGVVLLVEDGRVARAVHTSTGIGQNSTDFGTPTGTFKIQRKAQRGWSVPFKLWQPYAVTWNGGYALYGASDVPTAPSSFGGARVPMPEARNVWGFVDVGTPVRVI